MPPRVEIPAAMGAQEVRVEPMGDQAQVVSGPVDDGTEITLYVQQGAVLVRVTAFSQAGDPTTDAVDVAEIVLEK